MAFLRASATSLFATALLFASGASAAFQNDFSAYPSGAQSCLYQAADSSGCDGDTVAAMNTCLCGNEKGGFATLAAKCLGPNSPDLDTTYSVMSSSCAYSNTPLAISQAEWDAAASGSATSATAAKTTTTKPPGTTPATTSAGRITSTRLETITQDGTTLTTVITSTGEVTETSTSTSSPSPTQTGNGGGGGGTNAALIGGIAGGVAAVLLAVIAVVYFVLRRRLNAATKGRDESHPMLNNPGNSNGGPGGAPVAAGPGMFSGTNTHMNTPSPNLSSWGQTPTPAPTSPSMMGGAAAGAYNEDKGEWRPTSTAWTATPPPQPQTATGWGASPGQPHGQWNPPQPYQGAGAPYQGAVELPPQTAPQMYELDNTGAHQRFAEMPGGMMPPQQR